MNDRFALHLGHRDRCPPAANPSPSPPISPQPLLSGLSGHGRSALDSVTDTGWTPLHLACKAHRDRSPGTEDVFGVPRVAGDVESSERDLGHVVGVFPFFLTSFSRELSMFRSLRH